MAAGSRNLRSAPLLPWALLCGAAQAAWTTVQKTQRKAKAQAACASGDRRLTGSGGLTVRWA